MRFMSDFVKTVLLALMVALVIGIVVAVPISLIWALDTLFGLAIPFTFNTWVAALILVGIFGTRK